MATEAPAAVAAKALSVTTFNRFVEIGRVALIQDGPFSGKLAVIAEIIDHNRAIVHNPTHNVPRQSLAYKKMVLTPYVIKIPRAAGHGSVKKAFEASGVDAKFQASSWGLKLQQRIKRAGLTDFQKFTKMTLKKQQRDVQRKAIFKAKKSANKA